MSPEKPSALVIVDEADASLAELSERCGLAVTRASGADAAIAAADHALFDLILLRVSLEPASLARVAALHHACGNTPIVALGPIHDGLERAALRAGASEYASWPSSREALALVVAESLDGASGAPSSKRLPGLDSGLLGTSPQLRATRESLARVAAGTTTVLLRGETGTGKELAARAVHAQGPRRSAPFVKVHTPALPDALLESELFGYEKGAFTGAVARKPGRVELAERGTLFLDEIGEVSPTMQAKLLRLIQDREYERLGGTRTLRADIRVVAATHRDLEHLVETGAFREDLFYRLNVVSVWLPPLRARREDISLIARHYLQLFCERNHKQLRLDGTALQVLEAERWPGNVRQLVNVMERLVVLSTQEVITTDDVRRSLDEQLDFFTQAVPHAQALLGVVACAPSAPPATDAPATREPELEPTPRHAETLFSSAMRPLKEDLRRTELRAITKALHYAKGNRALAARLLGVSRRTLYTKLEEHGIE